MNRIFLHFGVFLFSFFISVENTFAQPVNDECDGAIEIIDVANWCSNVAEFANDDATASGFPAPFCFSNTDNDVWFKFTAVATDVTVTVIGASSPILGGTMWKPEVALYTGDCNGTINTFGCAADVSVQNNTIQLYEGGMVVGQEYFIRVDAGEDLGSFQLCIANYFAPVEPGSDCPIAAILCDKSPFVVQQVSGAGADPDEAAGSCLGGLGSTSESNSTWFSWTCETAGTLTFTLTPTFPSDDLDFVVYELPNGIGDCTGKMELRCMASGSFNFPSPCMGPTGLNDTATDFIEMSGCNQPTPQDNFLAALDMEVGKSYALLVNNFTSTGNGFEIEFGGTGEFLGPEADMETDDPDGEICFGESVTFSDNSTFALGALVGWEWNYGVDAVPATSSGLTPQTVTWTTPGLKTIVLTVESALGCIVVDVETILVSPCCQTLNAMTIVPTIDDVDCPDSQDGSIGLVVTSNAPPHTFAWENNQTTSGISNLGVGDYQVTITNDATCDTMLTYTVGGPPPFNFVPQITMPTCDAGQDGAIELIGFGGTPPYMYNWQNSGFTTDNTLTNIPVGIYDVVIEDLNGCQTSLSIEVNELELELQLGGTSSPSCFSLADGAIEITITNGLPPFQYDFNLGAGFQTSNTISNIPAGTYTVNVLDANLCEGNFEIIVSEPPPVAVSVDGVNVSCFGEGDGTVTAIAIGGVGNYTYLWSTTATTDALSNLTPETYTVTVFDGNGCQATANYIITQPNELLVDVVDIENVICFGDTNGSITVEGSGGNPPYEYSLDGIIFQESASFNDLPAGTYTVIIQDDLLCTDEVEATITEPLELTVDAGPDQTIDLGFSTNIITVYFPANLNVTYEWFPTNGLSCTDCSNPVATPVNSTTYTVTITDENGCTATDEITIVVVKNRPIYIPNAFSPNFDGNNDYFTIYGGPAAATIQELRIFNRWGAMVFEAKDVPLNEPTLGWDGTFKGKNLLPDVFAFYTYVRFVDGEVVLYEGDLTIVK